MRRTTRLLPNRIALLAMTCCSLAATGHGSGPPSFTLERLAEGVYAAIRTEGSGNIVNGNSLIVISREDVVVVDATSNPRTARALIRAIKGLTDRPVSHLVITHWHGDHSYGAQEFVDAWPGVQVVAHPATRDDLQGVGADNRRDYHASLPGTIQFLKEHLASGTGLDDSTITASERALLSADVAVAEEYLAQVPSLRVIQPGLVVTDSLVLQRDGRSIVIRHLGRGNTRGDLVVLLPNERIVATGDLVVWPTPYAFDSYLAEWADAIDTLIAFAPTHLVPGHGPVLTDGSYLELLRTTFRGLLAQADSLRSSGVSPDSVAARIDVGRYRDAFVGSDRARRQLWQFHFAGAARRLAAAQPE